MTGKEFLVAVGTPVAQREASMKKAERAQKRNDLLQQNLPGGDTLTAGQTEPRTPSTDGSNASAEAERPRAVVNSSGVDHLTGSQASVAVKSPVADDPRLLSLERTHDLVATHALRLSQSGNDSLRVVIEPGGGTRLSLELRYHNGRIEAQALLHRGDFELLNSRWAELQQRLEPRGVHLAALECPSQSSTGQRQSQRSGQQAADEPPQRSAFAEFAFDGSMEDSPAARRSRSKKYNGWETWV